VIGCRGHDRAGVDVERRDGFGGDLQGAAVGEGEHDHACAGVALRFGPCHLRRGLEGRAVELVGDVDGVTRVDADQHAALVEAAVVCNEGGVAEVL
jgi:hypothetical protein